MLTLFLTCHSIHDCGNIYITLWAFHSHLMLSIYTGIQLTPTTNDNRKQRWAAKTGNSHTTGTTTDGVEIPTANPEFSTTANSNKV